MLKIGLVGVGGISGTHIPAWQAREDAEIVALCDVVSEKMETYEGINKYHDLNEMLEKESLDILDVCLPTYLHTEAILAGLKKGLHVICEKPTSMNKEDIKVIYDTAKENHVLFMPAHVLRFWPEYVALKEIYDSQRYGKLLNGYMCRLSFRPKWSWDNWMTDEKRSGLVPYDLHIHDLDFMVYLLGGPKDVVKHRMKRPDQDYLNVIYQYEDFFVVAESSWFAAETPFKAGYRFVFEEAVVLYEDGALNIYKNDGTVINGGEAAAEGAAVINLPSTDAYAKGIEYFANCVKTGTNPDVIKPDELETVIDILNDLNE